MDDSTSFRAAIGGVPVEETGASPFMVAAIDVGGTKIAGALVRYENREAKPEIVLRRKVATEAKRGGAAVLKTICTLALELVEEAKSINGAPLLGVGVGTAGRVDIHDGKIDYANEIMPGWTGQPVRRALQEHCGVPAAVLNDVQAYALGEARHGAAAGCDACVMVAVGTGLGGAFVYDGKVMRGAHGFAGELGCSLSPYALDIVSEGHVIGRLESIASGSGIENCYRLAGGDPITGAEISARAAEGEELALRIVKQAGFSLGAAIVSWANIFDPDLVLLSGSVCNSGEIWNAALREGIASQTTGAVNLLKIGWATLGSDAPLIGAAENLLDSIGM